MKNIENKIDINEKWKEIRTKIGDLGKKKEEINEWINKDCILLASPTFKSM